MGQSDSLLQEKKDSVFYQNIKQKLQKGRLGTRLYELLFRDINSSQAQKALEELPKNPFLAFKGRIIRDIYIRQLDVFGARIDDTLRQPANWIEKLGNHLHRTTQERIIREFYLLFEEYQALDPRLMADNERLLRSTGLFHDARILVIADPKDKMVVDILIITQDIWSLLPTAASADPSRQRYSLALQERNFQGWGHTFSNELLYNGKDTLQKVGFAGDYFIPSLKRNWYLSLRSYLHYYRDVKQTGLAFDRAFIRNQTQYAYGASFGYNDLRNYVYAGRSDSLFSLPLRFYQSDLWISRSFQLPFANEATRENSRMIVGGRFNNLNFTSTPFSVNEQNKKREDSTRIYASRSLMLFHVGFSNRQYRRDALIFGYGRTEDVPYGYAAALIGGYEITSFEGRYYAGLRFSRGHYLPSDKGYVYALLNAGSYFINGRGEQGLLQTEINYFSPLLKTRNGAIRQFVNLSYTRGFNRFGYEYLTLNNEEGIRGVSSGQVRGTKKLVLNLETVFFSRINPLGFRAALFAFADMGFIGYDGQFLPQNTLYTGFGGGIRLRNENLTFSTFQFRLGYYPSFAGIPSPWRPDLGSLPPLPFRDFIVSKPEIIPFQRNLPF
jgi:hypothetical protein